MLSPEGAWSIAIVKLLTLSEQQYLVCDTADSACHGELTDFGFVFAVKNALCTETAAVVLETRVRARLRLACGLAWGSGH